MVKLQRGDNAVGRRDCHRFPLWHGKVATEIIFHGGKCYFGFRFGMVKLQLLIEASPHRASPTGFRFGMVKLQQVRGRRNRTLLEMFPLWHGKVATSPFVCSRQVLSLSFRFGMVKLQRKIRVP